MRCAHNGDLDMCRLLVSSKAHLAARDRCLRPQFVNVTPAQPHSPLRYSCGDTALTCAIIGKGKKADVVAYVTLSP